MESMYSLPSNLHLTQMGDANGGRADADSDFRCCQSTSRLPSAEQDGLRRERLELMLRSTEPRITVIQASDGTDSTEASN